MTNRDLQAAWRYHNGTKHPGGDLLNPWHRFDPAEQPLLFKRYLDLESIPLELDETPAGMSALAAIAGRVEPPGTARLPDRASLARLLYYSAGITKRIEYPGWGEMYFRAAAATGALYHIELYLVCGELNDLAAGVYHFDPADFSLKQLRRGDFRGVLVEASGQEPAIAQAAAAIIYTDVFWRNAVKYQARAYRHAFWDSGTIIAHTLAMAAAHGLPARLVAGFVDERINQLLGLESRQEAGLALLAVGSVPRQAAGPPPEISALSLRTQPISQHTSDFPAIHTIHQASSLSSPAEAARWRGAAPSTSPPEPAAAPVYLPPLSAEELPQAPIEKVIVRRGSARRFAPEAITLSQLATILDRSTQGIPADFLAGEPGGSLNQAYLIANAVRDLPAGAYVYHRQERALERLKAGSFRREAGGLALGQALAADASANIFFLSDLEQVLEKFGNRGYRAAQLDASITAGKVYLAAYALRLAATGLTFYDDAVTDFFSPHAQGKCVMFLIALGKRARRS